MARLVPWPKNERGKSVIVEVGIRAVWHGRTITQSVVSGRGHLIDRETLRWEGTVSLPPTANSGVAQQIEQVADLLVQPDCYTHLPIMRSAGFFAGVEAGTGNTNGEVRVKALIPQTDGLWVLLSPTAPGRGKDAVDGRFANNPKVGDYFQVGDRLCRVGAVKFGAADSTQLAPASTAQHPRPAILVEPAIGQTWKDENDSEPTELTPPKYVRARLSAPPAFSTARSRLKGPWSLQWTEYIPDSPAVKPAFSRIGELEDFSVPVGALKPIRIDRLWYFPPGSAMTVEASTTGEHISFPALAGTVQNVKGVRVGAATVTLTLRGPDGEELDEQTATATVVEKAGNEAPRQILTVPAMALKVGETKYVHMPGVVDDPDSDALTYDLGTTNGEIAKPFLRGDRVGVRGKGVGTATISVLVLDTSGLGRLIEWDVTVMRVDSDGDETRPLMENYRDLPDVSLTAHGIGSADSPDESSYSAGGYFRSSKGNPFSISLEWEDGAVEIVEWTVVGRTWRYLAKDVSILGAETEKSAKVWITATDTKTGATARGSQTITLSKPGVNRPPNWVSPIGNQVITDPDADPLEIPLAGRVVDPDGDDLQVTVTSSDPAKLTASFTAQSGDDAPGKIVLDRVTAKTVDSGDVTVTVAVTDGSNPADDETFDVNLPKATETGTSDLEWRTIPDQSITVGTDEPALDLTTYLQRNPAAPAVTAENTELSAESLDTTAVRVRTSGFRLTPTAVASRVVSGPSLVRQGRVRVTARRKTGTKRGKIETTITYSVVQWNQPPRWVGPSPADLRLKVGGASKTINLDDHSVDDDNPGTQRTYTKGTYSGADSIVSVSANPSSSSRGEKFDITPVGAGSTTLWMAMRATVGARSTVRQDVSLVVDADDTTPPKDPVSHTPLPDFPISGNLYPGGEVRFNARDYWSASGNSGTPDHFMLEVIRNRKLIGPMHVNHVSGDVRISIVNKKQNGVAALRMRARATDGGRGIWVPANWDNFNITVSPRVLPARPSFRAIPVQRATRGNIPFTINLSDYAVIPAGFGAVRYGYTLSPGQRTLLAPTIDRDTGLLTVPVPTATTWAGGYTFTVIIASSTNWLINGSGSFRLILQ